MPTALIDRHCEACTPDTPTLPEAQITGMLGEVDGWAVAETVDRHLVLTRTVRFRGFTPGVRLVDRIAELAEAEGHHPDLHLTYGSLTVDLWTHAAGGLTDNDFILAAKIDQIGPA